MAKDNNQQGNEEQTLDAQPQAQANEEQAEETRQIMLTGKTEEDLYAELANLKRSLGENQHLSTGAVARNYDDGTYVLQVLITTKNAES